MPSLQTQSAKIRSLFVAAISVFIFFAFPSSQESFINTQAHAATIPSTWSLVAAGERSSILTTTSFNATTLNNGTYWYYNNSSMGFSPTNTISQSSADITDMSCTATPKTGDRRLSWHTNATEIRGGWRVGCTVGLNSSLSAVRAAYQSNSPSYYPSGPQKTVSATTLTSNGWTLCWDSYYGESVLKTTLTNSCTQTYLLLAGYDSNETSATTLSTPATPTASPTSGTLKSIAVSWTAVSNASSYTLKLYASNGSTLLATITGLTGTSRTITTSDYASLADGSSYQVSITAIGNGTTYLDSLESTKRTVTTSQTLSNATLSSASPTSATLKSISLAWSAIANASNYTIKIYDSNDSLLETLTNVSGTSKTITASDYSSLADSTLYKFSIQAIGNNTSYLSSSESSKISATTHAPVTVTINRSLTNPYSSRNLRYTFTFSESVTGFTSSNLSVSGTSTGWTLGSLSGSGSSYSITLTNSSPIDGTINLTLDNSGIAAVSSSVQPATTSATVFTLGKATQVNTWIKFLWGEALQRF